MAYHHFRRNNQNRLNKRASVLLNDDDYDYALELLADDEYRQVAELIPAMKEFDDLEIDDENFLNTLESTYGGFQATKMGSQIQESQGPGLARSLSSSIASGVSGLINYENFRDRMGLLRKEKCWAESARRLSSLHLHSKYNIPEKLALDNFHMLLSGSGIHVRRHQSGCLSEMVRLSCKLKKGQKNQDSYSSSGLTSGSDIYEICWGKAIPELLVNQRKRDGIVDDRTDPSDNPNNVHSAAQDSSGLDYCIAVCGCGDDLLEGNADFNVDESRVMGGNDNDNQGLDAFHAGHRMPTSGHANDVDVSYPSWRRPQAAPRILSLRWIWGKNSGFDRLGSFPHINILAVHAATRDDPTSLGNKGTGNLRGSNDSYNELLTFSVVYHTPGPGDSSSSSSLWPFSFGQGVSTLDIECETEDTFLTLLRGFSLILKQISTATNCEEQQLGSRSSEDIVGIEGKAANTPLSSTGKPQTGEGVHRSGPCSPASVTCQSPPSTNVDEADPIQALFAGKVRKLPLRSMILSSLNSIGHTVASSTRGSLSTPSVVDPTSPQLNQALTQTELGSEKTSPYTLMAEEGVPRRVLLPVAQFLGWTSAGTQIWARLKMAGLDVKVVFSWDLRRVLLKVRCPLWRQEEIAEHIHLKIKDRTGSLRKFTVNKRDQFVRFNDSDLDSNYGGHSISSDRSLFRSSERQQIIDYIIRSKIKDGGAELDEDSELGSRYIVQRFPLHMHAKLNDIRHSWVTFWKQEPPGVVAKPWSPFSEPLVMTSERCLRAINGFWNGLLKQPLDHIAEYFGEDVAFYFAYLSYYTRWLVLPSIMGAVVFLFQVKDQRLDHWLCVPYAIAIIIWSCFMLAFWRQKSSAFAYRWGVLEYEVEETERPQFKGKYSYDDASGELRKVYPPWKRVLKYIVTVPVITVATIGMLVVMSTVFSTQDQLYFDFSQGNDLNWYPQFSFLFGAFSSSNGGSMGRYNYTAWNQTEHIPSDTTSNQQGSSVIPLATVIDLYSIDFWTVTLLYPSIYGILCQIMATIFEKLAEYLNDFENHRTQTVYMNRLILKVFCFQFITVFTSLYYFAFFARNEGQQLDSQASAASSAYLRIAVNIFALMTVGQWWAAFLDVFLPSLYYRVFLYRMNVHIASTNRTIYKAIEHIDKKLTKHQSEALDDGGCSLEAGMAETRLKGSDNKSSVLSIEKERIERRRNYLDQARESCWAEAIQMRYSTFTDYTALIMQLGLVILFAAVFPLAPLIALINNIVLIRLGALKICYSRQRPIAQKTSGLGVWEDVLQVMSAAGILTNCGLLGYTSNTLRLMFSSVQTISASATILVIFAFEHLLLFFKYWLHTSIPKVAPSVQRAQTRDRRSLHHGRGGGGGGGGPGKGKAKTKKPKQQQRPFVRSNTVESEYGQDQDPNSGSFNDAQGSDFAMTVLMELFGQNSDSAQLDAKRFRDISEDDINNLLLEAISNVKKSNAYSPNNSLSPSPCSSPRPDRSRSRSRSRSPEPRVRSSSRGIDASIDASKVHICSNKRTDTNHGDTKLAKDFFTFDINGSNENSPCLNDSSFDLETSRYGSEPGTPEQRQQQQPRDAIRVETLDFSDMNDVGIGEYENLPPRDANERPLGIAKGNRNDLNNHFKSIVDPGSPGKDVRIGAAFSDSSRSLPISTASGVRQTVTPVPVKSSASDTVPAKLIRPSRDEYVKKKLVAGTSVKEGSHSSSVLDKAMDWMVRRKQQQQHQQPSVPNSRRPGAAATISSATSSSTSLGRSRIEGTLNIRELGEATTPNNSAFKSRNIR